jgi:hypothetical protein
LLVAAAAAAAQSVTYRMSHGWKPVRRFALKGIELYNRTAPTSFFSSSVSPSFTSSSSFGGGNKKTTRYIISIFFILLVADKEREWPGVFPCAGL